MEQMVTHMFLSPGTILSEAYQIIRLIGQGGMGAVYLAYDTHLDLKVAIKVISSGVVENKENSGYDLALKRFQVEARVAAQIDHPNVIRIFGFKQDTIEYDGQNRQVDYLVMELMGDRTLRDTMDESGFEFEQDAMVWIPKYMIPVLEGLEKVHESGIIHRDIKPENIFMKGDVVKLADFGLSMGIDFPSITGSMVEILGTLAYMAPEQYSNFSMARQSADIFAIGRLLFEVIEGKITEKITPFTQVHLNDTRTAYYKALNHIIMEATAENPTERIGSICELKERLIDIHQCPISTPQARKGGQERKWKAKSLWLLLIVVVIGLSVFAIELLTNSKPIIGPEPQKKIEVQQSAGSQLVYGQLPKGFKKTIHADDNSVLRAVPPIGMKLMPENPFGEKEISSEAFYLSESPITNDQYIIFLNANIDRIERNDDDIMFNGQLVLKLSEKIRGYKPILFDGERFQVQRAMHSSCAVLMVTGYGAEAYAHFFGYRLVTAREWFVVMESNSNSDNPRLQLPTPVINYPQEKFGIRGINQISEWGKTKEDDFVILGQSVSSMVGDAVILEKQPTKYYTDTSFRVAKDAIFERYLY